MFYHSLMTLVYEENRKGREVFKQLSPTSIPRDYIIAVLVSVIIMKHKKQQQRTIIAIIIFVTTRYGITMNESNSDAVVPSYNSYYRFLHRIVLKCFFFLTLPLER